MTEELTKPGVQATSARLGDSKHQWFRARVVYHRPDTTAGAGARPRAGPGGARIQKLSISLRPRRSGLPRRAFREGAAPGNPRGQGPCPWPRRACTPVLRAGRAGRFRVRPPARRFTGTSRATRARPDADCGLLSYPSSVRRGRAPRGAAPSPSCAAPTRAELYGDASGRVPKPVFGAPSG